MYSSLFNNLIPAIVVLVFIVANAHLAQRIFLTWDSANEQPPPLDVSFWYSNLDHGIFGRTAGICTFVFWFLYSIAFPDYPAAREMLIGVGVGSQGIFFLKNLLRMYETRERLYFHLTVVLAWIAFYALAAETRLFILFLGTYTGYIVFWIVSLLNKAEDEREYL